MYNKLIDVPTRSHKPRTVGLTCLLDGGVPTRFYQDVIESHADHIDVIKFGWGTALVTRDIEKKIELARTHGISFYFGGTLFEKALSQNRVEQYIDFCKAAGSQYVEISNGTIDLANRDKAKMIAKFAKHFTVVSEVGYKDEQKSLNLSPAKWVEYIKQDLEAGASLVITEARESGKSGICRENGELRFGLIAEILESGIDPNRLVFEAPTKALQVFFVKKVGPNVNLGNIAFADVVGVETLRLGLRSDTLDTFATGPSDK